MQNPWPLPPALQKRIRAFVGEGQMLALMTSTGKATGFVFARLGAQSVMRLVSNFILVRLLEPEAFGLMSIGSTLATLIVLLSDIGLRGSVVRSDRGDDPVFLRTVWVTMIIRNAFLALIMCGAAAGLHVFRGELPPSSIWALDITPWFVAALSVDLIITSLKSPNMILAERKLDLKKLTQLQLITQAAAIPITAGLAYAGLGAWALLISSLFMSASMAFFSHRVLPGPKMAFQWDRDCFSEILKFGKWLLLASVAAFFTQRGDQFIFGSKMTAEMFSLLVIAGTWIKLASSLLQNLIRKVCLPAIAQCRREHKEDLPAVYSKFRLIADILSAGAFLGLVLCGDMILTLFYPPQFEPAKEFIPYLAFTLLFSPFILTNQVLLASGDSRNYAFIYVVAAAVMFAAVPFTFDRYGAYAAVFAFSVTGLLTFPQIIVAARRHLAIPLLTELRIVGFGAAAALVLFAFDK